MMKKIFCIIFCLTVFTASAKEIQISDRTEDDKIIIGKNAEYFSDFYGSMTLKEIAVLPSLHSDSEIKDKFQNSPVWIRFSLKNISSVWERIMEIEYPLLDNIEVYICGEILSECSVRRSGDHIPFSPGRDINYRNFAFRMTVPANQTLRVFIKVQTGGLLTVPTVIWKPDRFFEKTNLENFFFGAYYGIIAALIIYNLLLFFSIRDNVYLYYVSHILFTALYSGSADGLNFQFLWPEYPVFFDLTPVIFMPLLTGSLLLFSDRFLIMEKNYRKLHRQFIFFSVLSFFLALSAVFTEYRIMVRVQAAYTIFICLFLTAVSSYSFLKDRHRPAKFYILAVSILLVALILNRARFFGIIDHSLYTFQGIKLGSLIEIILLSLALGDFVNVLKEEKIRTEERAKKDLDRTKKEAEQRMRKEIERIHAYNHDSLGADLVDIIFRLNKFIHSETVSLDDLGLLKNTAEQAVFHLKSNMLSGSESENIERNFMDSMHLYIIERYYHAGRPVSCEVSEELENTADLKISVLRKEVIFLICKEISTNDLKYGKGISEWAFFKSEGYFVMEMNSESAYSEIGRKGVGTGSIQERADSIGGTINSFLENGRYSASLKVPFEEE